MSTDERFDYLDRVAIGVAAGSPDESAYAVLSTGERLYVALAASRADLIERDGKTLVQAIARLGDAWMQELIERWRYRPSARAIAEVKRHQEDE